MDLPNTLAEALEALTAARVDAQALDTLTAEHNETVNALLAAQSNLSAAVVSFEKLTAEHNALLAKFTAAESEASAKANTIVANLGVEPVAIIAAEDAPKTAKELWAEYHALPVEARNQFYTKHRDTLRS
jgi:NAD/NADP transhydrogenase alpha subunit